MKTLGASVVAALGAWGVGMLVEPPVRAFIEGVVLSNLWQWMAYWRKNPAEGWKGYWKMGLPHALGNIVIDVFVLVAWNAQWLDKAVAFVAPDSTANTGIPFTPEVGIMLGFGTDLLGDQIAYLAPKVLPKIPVIGWIFQQLGVGSDAPPKEGGS